MESKRKSEPYNLSIYSGLLIEPVWNRNFSGSISFTTIEYLLIEPVWNRNTDTDAGPNVLTISFNRTSMESKLV